MQKEKKYVDWSQYNLGLLCEGYISGYAELYGGGEMVPVYKRVFKSKKVERMINASMKESRILIKEDFEQVIKSMGTYLNSKPEIFTLALLISITRYKKEANITREVTILKLHLIAFLVITEANVCHVLHYLEAYCRNTFLLLRHANSGPEPSYINLIDRYKNK